MSIAAAPARGTPCLRVFADTLFVDDGSRRGDEVRTAMLRLDFDYGGRRFRAGDPRPSSLRDPGGEAQACRVLESLGAIELAQLEDCAVAPGAGVDYIVALDGDVHALCAFGAYAVPQLRSLGWRVEIDAEYPWQTIGNDAPLYAAAMPDDNRVLARRPSARLGGVRQDGPAVGPVDAAASRAARPHRAGDPGRVAR